MNSESADYRPVSELDFFRDNFFLVDGETALVRPEDFLKTIRDHPQDDLNPATMEAVDHYWLHEPYSYAVIVYSHSESEYQYWCVEPHLTHSERKQLSYLDEKIRIVAEDERILQADNDELAEIIQSILFDLVKRYDLADDDVLDQTSEVAAFQPQKAVQEDEEEVTGWRRRAMTALSRWLESLSTQRHSSEDVDEEIEEGNFTQTFSPKQVDKITYYLIRDIVGRSKINPLSHDFHVEDISCDGYNEPVFVHHTEFEEMWTNIHFEEEELDAFIKHLAQSSGKGISKRDPVADVTLDDGSRANLTLGTEVSKKGSNFTIRQFKPVPFTPVDLINWQTYSLEQMTYLWNAIEFGKNAIFAGGTASGKTTTLNAVSLFIPSKTKIVSIEDTPELELPHKNWVSSLTRSGGRGGNRDAFEEFDLLKNAFRQRPTYIVLGEVRGSEGRTLFQAMSSGHTTYTTFHANNANELVQRFTGDQIGVDKPAFEQLDLVCNQESVHVDGDKVRRSTEMKEVVGYDDDSQDVEFRDMYQWDPHTDSYDKADQSKVLKDIRYKSGWSKTEFAREFQKRQVVLAYLVREGFSEYSEVAGTIQAFMNAPDTILHYIATDQLGDFLDQLRSMKSIEIQVDQETEDKVNRPRPNAKVLDEANAVLDSAESLLQEYRTIDVGQGFRDADNPFEEEASILDKAKEAGFSPGNADTTPDPSADEKEDNEPLIDEVDADDKGEFEDDVVEAGVEQDPRDGMDIDKIPSEVFDGQNESHVEPQEIDGELHPDLPDGLDTSEAPTENGDGEIGSSEQDAEGSEAEVETPPSPPEPGTSDPTKSEANGEDPSNNDTIEVDPKPPEPTSSETAGQEDRDEEREATTTVIEQFFESREMDPEDLPFEFDPDDCHHVVEDDGQYRQCATPVGDRKKCHFHQDTSLDPADLEEAVNTAVVDGGSE
jgi:flagellar protein FlaI